MPRPALLLIAVTTLALALTVPASAAATSQRSVEREARAVLRDSLLAHSRRASPGDPRYFAAGRWVSGDDGCWTCNVGPGTAAAVLWRSTRAGWARRLAVRTFDHAIAAHRSPGGAFGTDIDTMFFASELGTAYRELKPALGRSRARRWRRALTGAAEFLIRNNSDHYTNGNVNLGNAYVLAVTWRATGSPRFRAAYRTALDFALAPPQWRWPGFGLRTLRAARRRDGADGAAFLAESGGGAPGFDPEYTQVQADVAARLLLLTRGPRAGRVANLLVNAVLGRTDGSWLLHTDGGSRHPQRGRTVPMFSSAPSVLAFRCGRTDLRRRLRGQFGRLKREYRDAIGFTHRNLYRGLGNQVAVVVQAARGSRRPFRGCRRR